MPLPGLEPVTGLEPASSAWKADVLPLHHTGIWRPAQPAQAARMPCMRSGHPYQEEYPMPGGVTTPALVGEPGFEPGTSRL